MKLEQKSVKKEIFEARTEILVKKAPDSAINALLNMNLSKENDDYKLCKFTLALAYLESKNYAEAAKVYYEINELYQAGFCELLQGNQELARKIWFSSKESSAINWGKCIIEILEGKEMVKNIPSFLQIRNYLESDISYFLQADKNDYAENLITCDEFFASINPEAYKFIGRALMNNGYPNLAANYYLKSQELIPQDPEIYFHLAQYSYQLNDIQNVKEMIYKCLELNRNFVPAQLLLEKLHSQLKITDTL